MAVSRFQRGTGSTYECRSCGKRTRETGDCEFGVRLCADCFEAAGIENEHNDGMHVETRCADCPLCNTPTPARE